MTQKEGKSLALFAMPLFAVTNGRMAPHGHRAFPREVLTS